ncbi:hypothetical protein F4678DRAFT_485350 [Xylaria arbuscula]|nr:hypothetical protein F4678DRAFT_485350 [Xylaria arbuscula]
MMMLLSVIYLGLRASLILVAAVVLGLSVSLAKHQVIGQVPAETGFSTFVGASGFFVSAVGMAVLWFDRINESIMIVLDATMSSFYLAAAICLTLAMKNVSSCTSGDMPIQYNRVTNKILSGGCIAVNKGLECMHAVTADGKDLTPSRCEMARTNYVFEYVGFVASVAMVFVGYLLARRGRGGTPTPSYH